MPAPRSSRSRVIKLEPLSELLDHWHVRSGTRESGQGLRPDLERTRSLVTELAPSAPCAAFYDRFNRSPATKPGWHRGREPGNKGRLFPAEVLTSDEIRAMLRMLPRRGAIALRNRALIVMLWRCGLRVAEALALEPKDVDLKLGTVTVLQGKGKKRRTVGIDPRACENIARWLEAREDLGLKPHEGKLFVVVQMPYRGRPMKTQNARDLLNVLARRAGVHRRVHPHGLRHTHAFELMKEGVPLPIIQKQLGHNDLATTAHYIDHLAPFEVIDAMQRREWGFQG
jgi:site-specific recombinase XerD